MSTCGRRDTSGWIVIVKPAWSFSRYPQSNWSRQISSRSCGFTNPWLLGAALMNIMGGRSSRYQLAGISIRSVSSPRTRGFIHASWYLRSEEHTSELQSPCNLVCRLLLEKKNKESITHHHVVHGCAH